MRFHWKGVKSCHNRWLRDNPGMSRPLRIEYEGAWYHVMNRGRSRQEIFTDSWDYRVFLDTVGEAVERYGLEVHAYCLMPNHYHLLVRTPWANLSRIMRHVDGLYTQRYNRRAGTDGALLRGRYKAILVEADACLLSVSRYIHRNPIDAARPLVERLEAWPWSSYPAYIGAADPPGWLCMESTQHALGGKDRPRAYRAFVAAGVEDDISRYYENQRAVPVLGREAFAQKAVSGNPESAEIPRKAGRGLVQPNEVLEAVAGEWGVGPEVLAARSRDVPAEAREARQLAMRLCRDRAGLKLTAIGELFGGIHYSGVSQNIRRLEKAMASDGEFRGKVKAVRSRLDPCDSLRQRPGSIGYRASPDC